jgi:2'-5' RNA ligase
MGAKRIFIAIDISEQARSSVNEYLDGLRHGFNTIRVSWELTEKLHLTLNFLGDVEEDRIVLINEAIVEVTRMYERFPTEIARTGVFPDRKKPRILWLGIGIGGPEIAELNGEIESKLSKAGFRSEKRKFHAHLTIGRLREPQKSRELVEEHLHSNFDPVTFTVSGLTLYESKIEKAGSIYSPIRLFPLN